MGKNKGSSKLKISGVGKIGDAKKRKNRKVVVALFSGVVLLILALSGLVLSNFGFFENAEARMFVVNDECSLVMGNLIHQIRDEGECRIKCVNECDVREMDFVRFIYESKNDGCNSCECWCE